MLGAAERVKRRAALRRISCPRSLDGPPWPGLKLGPVAREPRVKVAAIDLGKARVGVAVSDDLGLLAHPRPPLSGKSTRALLGSLAELAREEEITRFLVGLPL